MYFTPLAAPVTKLVPCPLFISCCFVDQEPFPCTHKRSAKKLNYTYDYCARYSSRDLTVLTGIFLA